MGLITLRVPLIGVGVNLKPVEIVEFDTHNRTLTLDNPPVTVRAYAGTTHRSEISSQRLQTTGGSRQSCTMTGSIKSGLD